ncbi:MAG: Crp/Fnr family transcriptional regulator [Bradyrhizobiaceae bacterium]|nr:Crp/Fnr family transcriptional regulator [Bradyrhizobiaceae bacterium]
MPAKTLSKFSNYLREVDYPEGTALWDAGDQVRQVVFPVSGTISIRVPTKDGHGIEVATIGHEGAVGFHDDGLPTVTQAVVQAPGRFIWITAQAFAAAALKCEDVRRLADICNGWLLLQSQQTAACNAVHAADARFCRWLLRASDALGADTVLVTQEAIAHALGIRRTTVTLIAQQLQLRGAISYRRGRVAIRDRANLQAAACDCYHKLDRSRWPSALLASIPVEEEDSTATR